jgi:adenylyl- and sulfurtransferase ThiI
MSLTWILRFGEITLKSRPVRRQFHRSLFRNLHAIASQRGVELKTQRLGALHLVISDDEPEEVEEVLSRVLGIVAIDRAEIICVNNEVDDVAKIVLAQDVKCGEARTFGVRAKRLGNNPDWNSQTFAGAVGHAMLQRDESLSVDLSNPDMWVKLILEPDKVWLLKGRIPGAGGLPSGVQGDVLCMLNEENDLLNSFLAMRRGCRLIPMKGSDKNAIEALASWDPFIGVVSDERKTPTGVIGASIEKAEEIIARKENQKIVPVCTLDSLCAWTESEKSDLKKHIFQPISNPQIMDIEAWVS